MVNLNSRPGSAWGASHSPSCHAPLPRSWVQPPLEATFQPLAICCFSHWYCAGLALVLSTARGPQADWLSRASQTCPSLAHPGVPVLLARQAWLRRRGSHGCCLEHPQAPCMSMSIYTCLQGPGGHHEGSCYGFSLAMHLCARLQCWPPKGDAGLQCRSTMENTGWRGPGLAEGHRQLMTATADFLAGIVT